MYLDNNDFTEETPGCVSPAHCQPLHTGPGVRKSARNYLWLSCWSQWQANMLKTKWGCLTLAGPIVGPPTPSAGRGGRVGTTPFCRFAPNGARASRKKQACAPFQGGTIDTRFYGSRSTGNLWAGDVKKPKVGFGFWQIISQKMAAEQRFWHHRVRLAQARRMVYFLFGWGQLKVLTSSQGQFRAHQATNLIEGGRIAYHSIREVFPSPLVAFPSRWLNLIMSYWRETPMTGVTS